MNTILPHAPTFAPIAIRLAGVGRRFAGEWAIRDVDGMIPGGSVTAVLGANGAGKSTLLRLIAGQLPLSEGAVELDGRRLRLGSISLRRQVLLLQDDASGPAITSKFLASIIRDYGADRVGIEDVVRDWLKRFDLASKFNVPMSTLSKGQRYKIALVALFAISPPIWLLDEPMSSGLDAVGLRALETELAMHASRGGTVVFSSQWPQHALRLADRVHVLHQGHLVWDGPVNISPPAELLATTDESLQAVLTGLAQPRPTEEGVT